MFEQATYRMTDIENDISHLKLREYLSILQNSRMIYENISCFKNSQKRKPK